MSNEDGKKMEPPAAAERKPIQVDVSAHVDGNVVEPKTASAPPCREIVVSSLADQATVPSPAKIDSVDQVPPAVRCAPVQPPAKGVVDPAAVTQLHSSPRGYNVGDLIHDRFTIVQDLGGGGQGIVLKCDDREFPGRPVLLKCVREDPLEGEKNLERRKRLKQEAVLGRVLAGNRGIVQVYETFESDDNFSVCMQYVEGQALSNSLQDIAFGVKQALAVCLRIAEAMAAAHGNKPSIIHRDIKPANVIVDQSGEAWLIDFGFARYASASSTTPGGSSGPKTTPGHQPGTIPYMSPEQRDGEQLDAETDVWSFGCVLFECLAKRRAFDGFCEFDDMGEPKIDWLQLPVCNPPLPSGVQYLLKECLQLHRRHRPRISKVAADLRSLIRELETPRTPAAAQRAQHNLPRANPLYCGRQQEMEKLEAMLLATDATVVTITRVDGMGKSTLAVETARRMLPKFPGGVRFVDTHFMTDRAVFIQGLSKALDVTSPSLDSIVRELASRTKAGRALLIVDGCDHLAADCPLIFQTLLDKCDQLVILATSSMRVEGKSFKDHPLKPLRVPPERGSTLGTEQLREYGAVELFYRIANQRFPDISLDSSVAAATIAQICRLVQGVPLAISLLAPLIGGMSLGEIADKLIEGDLGNDAQEILLRTFRSSFKSLTRTERKLLRRLMVFEAGWSAKAAKEICSDRSVEAAATDSESISQSSVQSLLTSLFQKSMIEHKFDPGSTTPGRYFMLAPIRVFLLHSKLGLTADAEGAGLRERHLRFYETFISSIESDLEDEKQVSRLEEVHLELPNILAALGFAKLNQPLRQIGLQLAAGMRQYWFVRGPVATGLAWLDEFAPDRLAADPSLQAKVANAAGTLTERGDKVSRARAEYETALDYYRTVGDEPRTAALLNNLGTVIGKLGLVNGSVEDWERCKACFEECIAIRIRLFDSIGDARAELNYSSQLIERNLHAEAKARLLRALPFLESDLKRHAMGLNNLGECEEALGLPSNALENYVRSCKEKRQLCNYFGWMYTNVRLSTLLCSLAAQELAARTIGLGQFLRADAKSSPKDIKTDADLMQSLSAAIGQKKLESCVMEGRDERNIDVLFEEILAFARAHRT